MWRAKPRAGKYPGVSHQERQPRGLGPAFSVPAIASREPLSLSGLQLPPVSTGRILPKVPTAGRLSRKRKMGPQIKSPSEHQSPRAAVRGLSFSPLTSLWFPQPPLLIREFLYKTAWESLRRRCRSGLEIEMNAGWGDPLPRFYEGKFPVKPTIR